MDTTSALQKLPRHMQQLHTEGLLIWLQVVIETKIFAKSVVESVLQCAVQLAKVLVKVVLRVPDIHGLVVDANGASPKQFRQLDKLTAVVVEADVVIVAHCARLCNCQEGLKM